MFGKCWLKGVKGVPLNLVFSVPGTIWQRWKIEISILKKKYEALTKIFLRHSEVTLNIYYSAVFLQLHCCQKIRGNNEAAVILSMCPANERRRGIVTSSLIGWAHTQNDPWWSRTNETWIRFFVVNTSCWKNSRIIGDLTPMRLLWAPNRWQRPWMRF